MFTRVIPATPPRIALDLDGCVFQYEHGLRSFLLAEGQSVPMEPASHWSLKESGWFKTEADFLVAHTRAVTVGGLYRDLLPYPDAIEVLQNLFSDGYQIDIVTSRFHGGVQHVSQFDTAVSLLNNEVPYTNILYLDDKARFDADIYVDDSPEQVLNYLRNGRKVIMPIREYNRYLLSGGWSAGPGAELFAANDWHEISNIISQELPIS